MTRTGRPPKPTALKKLAGNPGKRPLNESEPQPSGKLPAMPTDRLDNTAQLAWIHLRAELEPLGLLTAADAYTFELLCYHIGTARLAAAETRLEGITLQDQYGRVYHNPADKVHSQHAKAYTRLMAEFGLSPSSRSRLSSLASGGPEKSLADLLFEGTDDAKGGKVRKSPLSRLVGSKAARALGNIGLGTLEVAAMAAREGYDLAGIPGIGPATLKKLKAAA